LRFGEIPACIESVLDGVGTTKSSLESVRRADRSARELAQAFVRERVAGPTRSI
jgi:1-deoxy-D-xylulose 5-phosphate reductoisomerase